MNGAFWIIEFVFVSCRYFLIWKLISGCENTIKGAPGDISEFILTICSSNVFFLYWQFNRTIQKTLFHQYILEHWSGSVGIIGFRNSSAALPSYFQAPSAYHVCLLKTFGKNIVCHEVLCCIYLCAVWQKCSLLVAAVLHSLHLVALKAHANFFVTAVADFGVPVLTSLAVDEIGTVAGECTQIHLFRLYTICRVFCGAHHVMLQCVLGQKDLHNPLQWLSGYDSLLLSMKSWIRFPVVAATFERGRMQNCFCAELWVHIKEAWSFQ